MARTRLDAHASSRYSRGYRQCRRTHLRAGSRLDYRPVDRGRRRRIPCRCSSAARISRPGENSRETRQFSRSVRNNRFVTTQVSHFNGKDRKSTRLNSSHITISYAVFCLKKKKKKKQKT